MSIIYPWYKLGYIIPHLATDMDAYQFYRIAPEGMMLVTPCLNFQGHSLEAVEAVLPTFWERAELLAKKKVDRIALSGVPVASFLGRKRMRALLDEASQRTGLPCDTDLEAHIAALQHMGASKIALATRWGDATVSRLTAYLAECGIEVIGARSFSMSFAENKGSTPEDDHALALKLGREVLQATPGAQALLMPGGLWYAIHAVPVLEAEFGKPVLLNIISSTWAALHASPGHVLHRPDPHWGKVLSSI